MFSSLLSLSLAAAVYAAPYQLTSRQSICYKGVYVIGARGSSESDGYGSVESLVNDIRAAIPDSGSVPLKYPATVDSPSYDVSVKQGADAALGLIQDYQKSCPQGGIVLVGFSQGGEVFTDLLAGNNLTKVDPIGADLAKQSKQSDYDIRLSDPWMLTLFQSLLLLSSETLPSSTVSHSMPARTRTVMVYDFLSFTSIPH